MEERYGRLSNVCIDHASLLALLVRGSRRAPFSQEQKKKETSPAFALTFQFVLQILVGNNRQNATGFRGGMQ